MTSFAESLSPRVPVIDVSAWIGEYPFRGIPQSSLADLKQLMAKLNIERAIVSPFEAIFWENNLDAYARSADAFHGDEQLKVWPVLRPGALNGIEKLLDHHRPGGLRLLPNYHGYCLCDSAAAEIMHLARERKMIVQIFQRIADERWHWMLKVTEVDAMDLDYVSATFVDQPLIISGRATSDLLNWRLAQCPNLYADISRVRGPQFAIEQLVSACPPEKLLFGSLWPIQIIEATLWQVTTAKIDDSIRAKMLHQNASARA
jgi:hypothetical protein